MGTTSYFVRRFLLIIPTFLGITLLVFTVTRFVPGGPIEQMLNQAMLAGGDRSQALSSSRSAGGSVLSEAQLQQLRAYYGFMYGHPGKKLLFMGGEFAQEREWNHERSLDWHLLGDRAHAGVHRLVHDLNRLYRATPALWQRDFDASGFEWIDHDDAQRSVLSFIRRGDDARFVVVLANFTPGVQHGYRIGVPQPGTYRERLNTDSEHYGGSNVGSQHGQVTAEPVPWHGRPHSLVLTLPPLATVFFEWTA